MRRTRNRGLIGKKGGCRQMRRAAFLIERELCGVKGKMTGIFSPLLRVFIPFYRKIWYDKR